MKHVRSHLPRVLLGLMISVSLVLAGCANNGTGSSMLGGSGTDPDPRLTKVPIRHFSPLRASPPARPLPGLAFWPVPWRAPATRSNALSWPVLQRAAWPWGRTITTTTVAASTPIPHSACS
ncbi:hypothetical protein ALP29_201784 [Pseudomonas syringae pv. avii]|uniref:Uncharacterized protein n=1 Tax=Pseudomonas syringae pv. avii TaxID=663959 RepID=A0A3M5VBH5_PSESX|nr:hypothetical protein ALP29_201784 [Pseudomonas syringae pv. avii]